MLHVRHVTCELNIDSNFFFASAYVTTSMRLNDNQLQPAEGRYKSSPCRIAAGYTSSFMSIR
ncbi:hypothetical protein Hanom_Chr08g00703951 [Helianthus anomalus]